MPDRYRTTVVSGYFDDFDKLAAEAITANNAGGECYVTLNTIDPALLSRRCNRVERNPKESTADHHIARRRWLLIDIDAQRPSGISASDIEHDAAIQKARDIRYYLCDDLGWPAPVAADSGNGSHVLFRIDLPNDDVSRDTIQRCLAALAHLFNNDQCKVDQSVFNAGRITKLYGCVARKGDSTDDRPHRLSRLLHVPDQVEIVTPDQLIALASEARQAEPKHQQNGHHDSGQRRGKFDLEDFVRRNGLQVNDPQAWKSGGRRWTFTSCPMCEHGSDGPFIIQQPDGAIAAGCHHESCNWNWHDLRQRLEPRHTNGTRNQAPPTDDDPFLSDDSPTLVPVPIGQLIQDHPRLHEPIIDGIVRRGETMNVIAPSKVGKSWLSYGLALAIATGSEWLDTFQAHAGRVLLIDNELHPPTIAHRVPAVAEALEIQSYHYSNRLDVISLRGQLKTFFGIADLIESIADVYDVIIIDAYYRMLPSGVSENDNASIASIYNTIDRYAAMTNAAWILIHHSSKGGQADKAVTDVGAGAGSQSRAADTHLVLRPHEDDGCVVLDCALRSFPPVDPIALKWQFPIWVPDHNADPSKLAGRLNRNEMRQRGKDLEGIAEVVKVLEVAPATPGGIVKQTTLTKPRAIRLLNIMFNNGDVTRDAVTIRGNETQRYALK